MTRGAYGIRIDGIVERDNLLVEARPDWPAIRLQVDLGAEPHSKEHVDDRAAALNLKTGGRLTVDRDEGVARFAVDRPLSDDELIHPFLAPVASIVAHWQQRIAFHAGAIAVDGGAWGVVGERGAGKSSLLALLSREGVDVVADDVLVLGAGAAFAGPRTIDLREDSAERLGGEALGLAGARPRWRVTLPQIAATLPFQGWIFLAWDREARVTEVPASERLGRLMASLALRMSVANPPELLPLAALPGLELGRPRAWDGAAEVSARLLSAIAARR